MKLISLKNIACCLLLGSTLTGCTNLDEIWYDKVTPETFYKSKEDVLAALYRPFTHARWYVGSDRWFLQETVSDHFVISTKGPHWYNGGEPARMQHHEWTADEGKIWETWRGTLMGVALALDTRQDLEKLDYSRLAMSQDEKDDHLNQLSTLVAYFYLRGLDYFGGLPIFSDLEGSNPPRNTDKEVFDHVEALLLEAITKLPAKQDGQAEEGALRQGAAAMMLAQLYFNAESYIKTPMYEQCAQLCTDLINGKYGEYKLDMAWNGPHNFENNQSKEIIWSFPSEFKKLQYDWFWSNFYHYNSRVYFDIDGGADNGGHLQPSRKPDGSLYKNDFKLGSPYEKFEDEDLRKKPFKYFGSGQYEGMFLVGEQISPVTGAQCLGTQEYKSKLLVLVDQVARFSELKPGEDPSTLKSTVSHGEENSGIRLVKVPIPSKKDNALRWGADCPVLRLAEVYYMLAECKFRQGDKAGAAELFNTVRARAFENNQDPNPVTAANIDKYRILDEWGVEFLGEGRRRTDLIRWNCFTTEQWWDHTPSNSDHLNRYPVPTDAIAGNNNLEQNPGY